jgi:hypothetical protein
MKKYGIPLTAFDIVGDSMEGEHSVFELDNFLSKLGMYHFFTTHDFLS